MNISKAVITAAGGNQRGLPLQTLVDRDGRTKTALQILIEEALSGGVTDIAVVVPPGDEPAFARAAGDYARRLAFIPQTDPRGYGDAIHRARSFTGDEAFLHLVGDHLCLSSVPTSCAAQLIEVANREDCAVSAVQATRESLLPNFGAVGGKRLHGNVFTVDRVLEKPTPTEAEQTLIVPGLRAGHYLCFFGMHVLTPAVMALLAEPGATLSGALDALIHRERYLALSVIGTRYDIGVKYGLLGAQLALALSGPDRADVLAQIVEVMAR